MDKPMEHLKVLRNRYGGVLKPNETAVYFELFMLANQRYWPEWIEISDWQLASNANVSAKRIPDVINVLMQRGLIESRRGKGKSLSAYKLIYYTQMGIINEKKTGDKREINGNKTGDKREINGRNESETPCESKGDGIAKTQHNTTQHKESKEKKKKKQYAENVFLTEDEYAKLLERLNGNTSAVSWCIEKLDNSKGAKGYKYKSDYRAILNWVIDDYVKKNGKLSPCQIELPIHQGDDNFGTEAAI